SQLGGAEEGQDVALDGLTISQARRGPVAVPGLPPQLGHLGHASPPCATVDLPPARVLGREPSQRLSGFPAGVERADADLPTTDAHPGLVSARASTTDGAEC